MRTDFFKIKDETMIFEGEYMESYIQDKFFKKDLNEVYGDTVRMMGIFNFRVGGKNHEVNESSKLYTFNFPTMINTKPSAIETKQLNLNGVTESYRVLKYYKGDLMLTSTNIVMDISNVQKFVNLLMAGALPTTLEYDTVLQMFYKNLELNNETCNVSAPTLSTCVSELYRWSKDNSIPFRRAPEGTKPTEYTPSNARSVCANTSTFTALTFEDQNTMLLYSINRKRKGKRQTKSPIEQIIHV